VGKGAQTLDYTTLVACCHELSSNWVPAKVEEVRVVLSHVQQTSSLLTAVAQH
jgi:hypothetical protein